MFEAPVTPVTAALQALVISVGNCAVALGALGVNTATTLESASVTLLMVAYVVVNELRHHTVTTAGATVKAAAMTTPVVLPAKAPKVASATK